MATLTGTAWDKVPIRAKFLTLEDPPAPVAGVVTAYIDRTVVDQTTNVMLLHTRAFKVWTLDATGALPPDASLPATDDPDIYPQNFNIRLVVTPTNADEYVLYVRPLLVDVTPGIDLSDVISDQVVSDSLPTVRDTVGGLASWNGTRSLLAPDGQTLTLTTWANGTSLLAPDGSTIIVPKTLSDLASPTKTYNFGGQLLTNLGSPVNTTDAATKAYVDSRAMGTGNADMAGYRIINLGTPTADTDAATKNYVDGQISMANNWSAWTPFTPTLAVTSSSTAWTFQTQNYAGNFDTNLTNAPAIFRNAYRTRGYEVDLQLSIHAVSAASYVVGSGQTAAQQPLTLGAPIKFSGIPASICPSEEYLLATTSNTNPRSDTAASRITALWAYSTIAVPSPSATPSVTPSKFTTSSPAFANGSLTDDPNWSFNGSAMVAARITPGGYVAVTNGITTYSNTSGGSGYWHNYTSIRMRYSLGG